MNVDTGARLGHYEIVGALGKGGMGEVYRARDTKLNREVALKVLPPAFAQDPERLARFEREAHVLASVNHPNIAQVYNFENDLGSRLPTDGTSTTPPIVFLVMELVEGEDLSDRIAREPFDLAEGLQVARQITNALDAAHSQGIVHRDLKPANIKLTAAGHVKVLDFGLAKALAPERTGTPVDAMNSPTLTARGTQIGTILGTAAYMAPEQARGRAVDKRADIWAFGCVLYEMVTGRRAFAGEDVTETLAAVVKEQPDLTVAPPEVRRLLERCLTKDPGKRLRDIADVWDLIDDPRVTTAVTPARASLLPWLLASVAALAALGLGIIHFGEAAPTPALIRFDVPWPGEGSDTGGSGSARFFQLSPDGRHLAIVSQGALWVRSIDAIDAVRLERTEGATYPFWAPDSERIGFFAGGQLKKIARTGGTVQTVTDAPDPRGGTWAPNGTIVFSDRFGEMGLSRVSDAGGPRTQLTTVTTKGASDAHRYPQFLPDGAHFLYLQLSGDPDVTGVYVGSLEASPGVRVLEGADNALYAATPGRPTGHLLFRRENTLMAQSFDPATRQTSGTPFLVDGGAGQGENTGLGAFSAADSGALVFSADALMRSELVWRDRSGKLLGVVSPAGRFTGFDLSRDEKHIALGLADESASRDESDIWTITLPKGVPSRFTFGPTPGWDNPVFSPAGDQIAYTTYNLAGLKGYEIRRRATNRAGSEETLARFPSLTFLWDWTSDGKSLLSVHDGNLWMLSLEGDRKPVQLTKAEFEIETPQVSTDRRWVAYSALDRGQRQVYVQPFPAMGPKWLVSTDGGTMPRWRHDGKELYYRGSDGRLVVVPVNVTARDTFLAEATTTLAITVPLSGNVQRFTYEPSVGGQRFLVASPVANATPRITVVLNWQSGIRR